ncbi:unnamed protein product [Arctia plantaginis]|uniref:Uncharacterized protein n=1 Tax=Arctia plantaginis TaxID=874455 RepID=A0A8S1BCE3_ARCPL|nr:unnamed protein product [Arctia plantaginis]CAB3255489.1 unnamed protein product [Arctia plantaginis]
MFRCAAGATHVARDELSGATGAERAVGRRRRRPIAVRADARRPANERRAVRGVPRPCCRRDALMLFLPTRRREKAPRGFKLLYVDKTLL